MSPLVSRPTALIRHGGAFVFLLRFSLPCLSCRASGRLRPIGQSRYLLIDKSLLASDYQEADAIVQQAEKEYGAKSRVLYGMDRGMTLQLAGEYQQSNAYWRRLKRKWIVSIQERFERKPLAFMTNDNTLPYEGDPYEQVMINVLKALNYALLNQWQDALVEARRIDHRLNVLVGSNQGQGCLSGRRVCALSQRHPL